MNIGCMLLALKSDLGLSGDSSIFRKIKRKKIINMLYLKKNNKLKKQTKYSPMRVKYLDTHCKYVEPTFDPAIIFYQMVTHK